MNSRKPLKIIPPIPLTSLKNNQPTQNTIIKKLTCYVGSEWPKAMFFLLCLTIKIVIELIYVLNIKMNSQAFNISLSIIAIILHLSNVFLCLKCVLSNPGVLPANTDINVESFLRNAKKLQVIKGRLYNIKICKTCNIVRPVGSSHCSKCNVCIERFDHHCPWVGSCIGRNTFKYFYYKLITINAYFIMSFCYNISNFIEIYSCLHSPLLKHQNCQVIYKHDIVKYGNGQEKIEYDDSITISMYISLVLIILLGLALIFVISLFMCHSIYLSKNETTYIRARMKHITNVYGNPFNNGCIQNFKRNLCNKNKVRTNTKASFLRNLALFQNVEKQKFNDSNCPINVSYNCFFSYNDNSKNQLNTNMMQNTLMNAAIYHKGSLVHKQNKINGTFSNYSKSFEEDQYSQQNTLQYKQENSSHFSENNINSNQQNNYMNKNSISEGNILKANIFFQNHDADDQKSSRDPNMIHDTK